MCCFQFILLGETDMAGLFDIPIKLNIDRQILHVDMDAFYAQIEMRDHPEYHDQAIILADDPRLHGGRGVVATANYAARKLGVHSAQNAVDALKLAPDAIFVKPDFEKYRRVSQQVHHIFHRLTDKIEPIASDEAYLDITENKLQLDGMVAMHWLQQVIYDELQLTSSVGLSFNKFLAKLASEHNKPLGLTIVRPEDIRPFLDILPIENIRGVGVKTAEKMRAMNILTGADLYEMAQDDLVAKFGRAGYDFYQHIRGVDNRDVAWQHERQSIGKERTYGPFLDTEDMIFTQLTELAGTLSAALQTQQRHGKTLVLKIRFDDFETETRRRTSIDYLENDSDVLVRMAQDIWEEMGGYSRPIRLLGLTMTNLMPLTFENLPLNLYGG